MKGEGTSPDSVISMLFLIRARITSKLIDKIEKFGIQIIEDIRHIMQDSLSAASV